MVRSIVIFAGSDTQATADGTFLISQPILYLLWKYFEKVAYSESSLLQDIILRNLSTRNFVMLVLHGIILLALLPIGGSY